MANALSCLLDVSFYDGGRQVTITSSFEILNKTSHKIQLASHPNPLHNSRGKNRNGNRERNFSDPDKKKSDDFNDSKFNDCKFQVISPGETKQVPLLLLESSLQQKGSHLGSFWFKPLEQLDFIHCLDIPGLNAEDASIELCSNPIQLIHLVNDSAAMFLETGGNVSGSESFSSGHQLSCPIVEKRKESVLPFCYCIEVKRSPLVAPFTGHDNSSAYKDNSEKEIKHVNLHDKELNETLSYTTLDEKSESVSNKTTVSKNNLNGRDGKKPKKSLLHDHTVHGPVA